MECSHRTTFANLLLFKLHDINVFETICFVYKSHHGLLLPHFCNLFVLNSEVRHHDTRNKNVILQVAHRINARALSIEVYVMKIWNALPTFIRNSPTFPIFKNDVRLIIANCWYFFTSLLLI